MVEKLNRELDVIGLRCPLPLLKTKKMLHEMTTGAVLTVLATDPGSERDFAVYTDQSGHELLESREESGIFTYVIKKG